MRLDVVESRSVSRIAPKRDLLVAGLFAPDLKVWGLSRGELIETPKVNLWPNRPMGSGDPPRSIGPRRPDLHVAPERDPDQCVDPRFEDRVSEETFDIYDCIDVSADADLLLELRKFGRRAGITIVF